MGKVLRGQCDRQAIYDRPLRESRSRSWQVSWLSMTKIHFIKQRVTLPILFCLVEFQLCSALFLVLPSLMPARLMPVSLMPNFWCRFFDASHYWCPSRLMPMKLFWCQSLLMPVTIHAQEALLMPVSVTFDVSHYWCPSPLMPVTIDAGPF